MDCSFKHSNRTRVEGPRQLPKAAWQPPCPATKHAALAESRSRDVVIDLSNIVLGCMNSGGDE